MKHRHLTHQTLTLAAIEDILARGSLPDWVPLVRAIDADPYGEVAEKTHRICAARDIYGSSKLFAMLIERARTDLSRSTFLNFTHHLTHLRHRRRV